MCLPKGELLDEWKGASQKRLAPITVGGIYSVTLSAMFTPG
jgi:hypothetical protein